MGAYVQHARTEHCALHSDGALSEDFTCWVTYGVLWRETSHLVSWAMCGVVEKAPVSLLGDARGSFPLARRALLGSVYVVSVIDF
jgi:hypothetical protein